jgi:preprotein translocase subunit SecB
MSNPLQLEDYYLTKLHIDWRAPSRSEVNVEEIKTGLDYDVAVHAKERHRYKLDLRIRLTETGKEQKDVGYEVEADIVGLFAFEETCEKETREKLIRLNGVSILYSTFRGILGGMTGMFQGRRLTLPTIMPNEVVRRVEEAKATKRASGKESRTIATAKS